MGSLKRNRSSSACTKLAPRRPVRQTPAAVMEAGACSWAAMGSASATVTLRGTSARASSAHSSPAQMGASKRAAN